MMSSDEEDTGQMSSQLDEQMLQDIEKEAEQGRTAQATSWAWNRFSAWLSKREIDEDPVMMSTESLAAVLYRFYGELRCEKTKAALSPSSLVGIRAGIQRALQQRRTDGIHIVQDPVFTKANNMLKAKCRLYAKNGNPKPQRKPEISNGDLIKISEYFSAANKAENSRKLQQAVWYTLAINLGCRGREIYRQLKKDCLVWAKDDIGKEYVTINQAVVEKNHPGGTTPGDQYSCDNRIYDCQYGEHGLLSLLKLYISKLHPECPWLFQQHRHRPTSSDEVWFKNEPLGINTIAKIMPTISKDAGLSQTYTNHSVRSTTITILHSEGVEPRRIMARTCHKRQESLDPYIGATSTAQQKRQEAAMIHNAMSVAVRPDNSSATESRTVLTQGDKQDSAISGVFNSCTINIHYHK